jgi:Asp-tRNA(Asn)/Glu-tRNA(Gln) amidotransferase A subunit family amidase
MRPFPTLFALAFALARPWAQAKEPFSVQESSLLEIREALRAGEVTCRHLAELYLERIGAYDKKGPAINSILSLNPRALEIADALDADLRGGAMKPLHCVPLAVKDNLDTADMPTTAGSAALAGSAPSRDAAVVARLRESGALILAKTNLHEFALAGMTLSSLGGQTLNPYDLSRTPGGSSGGTGAAVAASFAAAGLGSDTMNSVRSPASANGLVGVRPTRGLLSRAGLVPCSFTQDAVGPIARTVSDAALLLDAMAGYDPEDPSTALGVGMGPGAPYASLLKRGALKGARLGVVRTFFGAGPEHEEVNAVMRRALDALAREGAVLVDVVDPAFDSDALHDSLDVQRFEFRRDMNAYLERLGPGAPAHSLAEIVASGKTHPACREFLADALSRENGTAEPGYKDRRVGIEDLRARVADRMARDRLDALVYPHQKRLAVPVTDKVQAGRNGILASLIGYPAVTVPAGFSPPTERAPIGVPVGLEFLGRAWSEPLLLSLARDFEAATRARRPPRSTP